MDKLLFAVIFHFFLYGCQSAEKKDTLPIFGKQLKIEGSVLIPSESLLDPWMLLTIDSCLIVANAKNQPIFDIFNLTGKKIKSYGKRGLESLDFGIVATMQPNYTEHCFFTYDLFRRDIFRFDIKDLLNEKDYEATIISDSVNLGISSKICSKVYVLKSGFLGQSKIDKGRILVFKKGGKSVNFFGKYPSKIDPTLSDIENASLYSMGLALSPGNDKVASITYNAGILNSYKLNGTEPDSVFSYVDFLPSGFLKQSFGSDSAPRIAYTKESKYGYFDLAVTSDWIYCIYSGDHVTGERHPCSNIIRVTNWEGTKRYQLVTNKRIYRLTVSLDNNLIYAAGLNEKGAPEIYAFNIKNILN